MVDVLHFFLHRNSRRQTSADPDQMPQNAASEVGLYCLHTTL